MTHTHTPGGDETDSPFAVYTPLGSASTEPARYDHAAWGYRSEGERAAAATTWLARGLRDGWRAVYVADAPTEQLLTDLAAIPGLDAAVDAGALVALPTAAAYDLRAPIDAATQLAGYAAAVDRAVADGYRGIRAVADITPLVRDPVRRAAHLQWEQVADRYITGHPLAPLCLFDTRVLDCVDPIVCVHPLQGPDPAGFAVYGQGARQVRLEGEVDHFGATTLELIVAALPDTDEVLDLSDLAFMDVAAATALQRALTVRRQRAGRLDVVGTPQVLRRIWDVLGFDRSLLDAA